MMDEHAQRSDSDSEQDDMPVGESSLTQTKEVTSNYTWTIYNFELHSNKLKQGELIKSPCFSVKGNDKWRLHLYPNGNNEKCSAFLSLFLCLVSCEKSEVRASLDFSILDCKFSRTNEHQDTTNFNQGMKYGWNSFIKRDDLLNNSKCLLPEGKLKICCKVSVKEDTLDISGQSDLVQVKNPGGFVSDDLGKLFDNMTLSDVTLVADGKEIRAHKNILVARSTVFAAMFEHDMLEQKLSRVDIDDVDHDTLTEMLRFIYTDHAPNIDKMAADLLVAADKYELDSLKLVCEEVLCMNLSVETAADTLVLADLHSAALLKKQTIAFINSRHARNVMKTEGWKKMTSTHPHLVTKLFSNFTVLLHHHLPIYRSSK